MVLREGRKDIRIPDREERQILIQYGLNPNNWHVQWANDSEVHFVSTRGRGRTFSKRRAVWDRKYGGRL